MVWRSVVSKRRKSRRLNIDVDVDLISSYPWIDGWHRSVIYLISVATDRSYLGGSKRHGWSPQVVSRTSKYWVLLRMYEYSVCTAV